jgi:crossover junction endodeoxyribonuclease RuvC
VKPLRILGIDPGLAIMGWGIIEVDNYREHLVQYGALQTYPRDTFPTRLLSLQKGVRSLLDTFRPDEIAFEELFFSKNVTTGIQVGGARGIALAVCRDYTDRLFEYTPMQIKQAVVGHGGADKHQVQAMVRILLGLREIPKPDDAADAVACAICHAHTGVGRDTFRIR